MPKSGLEKMEILQDSNIWFLFSFIIFVFILVKFGGPFIINALDARIEEIKKDLKESESLRVEAQEMLAQYQRKHRDAVQEAEKILDNARENAAQYKEKAEAELQEVMKRREQQLTERLSRMEQNAIQEIQSYAADLSLKAAQDMIIENLDKKTSGNLIDQSIARI